MRHVGAYHKVGRAWSRLHKWAGRRRLLRRGRARIGVSHDDPDVTADDRLRYDACLEIADTDVEPAGDVGVQTLLGGRHAVFVHRGAFSRLPETYDAFFGSWLPRSGLFCADAPCLNFHLNLLVPAGSSEAERAAQLLARTGATRLFLTRGLESSEGYASHEPVVEELEGKTGEALTALRPTGKARIDGRRLNVETEGDFVDKGEELRVLRQEEGRIGVRRA